MNHDEKPKWFADHEKSDLEHFRTLEAKIDAQPNKEEITKLFDESLKSFFGRGGKTAKGFIIGLAVVIGSVTVIFGGLKAILSWIGFNYIRP